MSQLETEAFELIKKSGSIMMHRIGEILNAPMDEVRYVCNNLANSNDIVIQDGIDNDDKPCQVCSVVKKDPARAMSKVELAIEIIKIKGYATSKDLKDAMGVMSPQPHIKNQLQNGTIVYRDGRYFLGRAIVKDPEIRPSDTPESKTDTEKPESGIQNVCSCLEQSSEHPVTFPEKVLSHQSQDPAHDPVKAPNHYTVGGLEVKEILKAKLTPEEYRGYCKGNIIKYLMRAEHKGNPVQDYAKANQYSQWLAEFFEIDLKKAEEERQALLDEIRAIHG